MKIVYISSSILPSRRANSIHVMKMCQAFVKNGHEVTLIAPDKKKNKEPEVNNIFDFYGVKRCFEIIKLPWLPIMWRRYVYGLLASKKAKSLNPNLVYCRNIHGCFFASLLGLPVIFESHRPAENSDILIKWMFKKLLNSTNLQKLVVNTSALKEYYEAIYSSANGKIQVSSNAADPVPKGIRPIDLPNKDKRMQVGYVGQLYKGKGMEIISQLAKHSPRSNFHVIGGINRDITYWKINCNSSENLFFYRFMPPSEVTKYIQAFDVVLLPNQNKVTTRNGGHDYGQWTSPVKAFEYMAAGKPIIASDIPVLREIFENEHNALLCPPNDISAWHDALEHLKNTPELRERLSKNAYKDFEINYTWQARAKNCLEKQ